MAVWVEVMVAGRVCVGVGVGVEVMVADRVCVGVGVGVDVMVAGRVCVGVGVVRVGSGRRINGRKKRTEPGVRVGGVVVALGDGVGVAVAPAAVQV